MKNLGPVHVIILLAVVILIFGAKRLPDVAKSVGQSMKIFKNEVKDLRTDDAPPADATPNTAPPVQNTVVTPPPVVVQTPVVPTPDRPEPTEGSAPPKS
nr:Sec-independent protein translocase subunit TatA [Cellulomonas sp. URHD0024]